MKKLFQPLLLGLSPFFIVMFAVLGILFRINPEWDIWFSNLFFHPEDSFYMANAWWANSVYHGVHYATGILIAFYVVYLLISFLGKREKLWGIPRKSIIYLAAVLALGPGLVVNIVLKDQMGRARPANTMCFNGVEQFTPAFQFSNACDKNCSFVSGHAGFGFYWITLGFLAATPLRRRQGIMFSVFMGSAIGLVRIIQGRHFLSDVIFSFFFVYAVAAVVHWFMYEKGGNTVKQSKELTDQQL